MNELGLAGLIGIFLPLVVSLLKGREWPAFLKVGLTLVVSLAGGVVTSATDGNISFSGDIVEDPEQLLSTAAAAFTAATVVYQTYFKSTQVNEALTAFPNG